MYFLTLPCLLLYFHSLTCFPIYHLFASHSTGCTVFTVLSYIFLFSLYYQDPIHYPVVAHISLHLPPVGWYSWTLYFFFQFPVSLFSCFFPLLTFLLYRCITDPQMCIKYSSVWLSHIPLLWMLVFSWRLSQVLVVNPCQERIDSLLRLSSVSVFFHSQLISFSCWHFSSTLVTVVLLMVSEHFLFSPFEIALRCLQIHVHLNSDFQRSDLYFFFNIEQLLVLSIVLLPFFNM